MFCHSGSQFFVVGGAVTAFLFRMAALFALERLVSVTFNELLWNSISGDGWVTLSGCSQLRRDVRYVLYRST
jgi:hypothetical protein